MNDFSPDIRNTALWSGDSRRIADGDAAGVVLEKLGRIEREDISDEEHVRMGHRLQPVVARIFEDIHNVRLKELDVALTHPKHQWMRSHFDYEAADSSFLVECKNYDKNAAQYFSEPEEYPIRVPAAERAQCLHEACVHGTEFVWLAVLFGGQRYRDFRLTFTQEEKDAWEARLAAVWAHIEAGTVPPPANAEQAREIWPQDDSHTIVANKRIEMLCLQLSQYKAAAKVMDENIDRAQTEIMSYMGGRAALLDITGKTLATWKTAKSSRRFSAQALQSAMPETYEQFCVETIGSRRFLLK